MRPGRARPWLLVLVLTLATARGAAGDPDEMDRRLKSARVDAKLRADVRRAVDRGVEFLTKAQRPDGSFAERLATTRGAPPRATFVTLLAALALRHAGTPPADPAVEKALRWAFETDPERARAIETRAADAGLALACLSSLPREQARAKRLLDALVLALDPGTGWWSGDAPGSRYSWQPPASGSPTDARPNLIDSQFAVLGLLAARRLGLAAPPSVWARHAEGLVRAQTDHASWPFSPSVGGIGEAAGTYVGLANLLAARSAGVRDAPTTKAVDRALRALARDATYTVTAPRGHFVVLEDAEAFSGPTPSFVHSVQSPTPETSTDPGDVAYVRLFALGRACTSADVESFDVDAQGRPVASREKAEQRLWWFSRAARWLVGAQRESGGWAPAGDEAAGGEASEIETSYALLFLVRAMDAFHPVRPAPLDANPRPAKSSPPSAPAMGG